MKKYLTILTILIFIPSLYAQFTFREIIHLPWGGGDRQAGFRAVPGGQFGPMSFAVKKDTVFLLDSQNKFLKIFYQKALLQKITLPSENTDDFAWRSSRHYFRLSNNILLEIVNQQIVQAYQPESPRDLITEIRQEPQQGKVYAVLNDAHAVQPVPGKKLKTIQGQTLPDGRGHFVQVLKTAPRKIVVHRDGQRAFEIAAADYDLGSAKFLGATPAGNYYIYLEKIVQSLPLQVERSVQLHESRGKVKARFQIPSQHHTDIFKEFHVDAAGNLYQMISIPNGIYIVAWFAGDRDFNRQTIYKYPKKYSSPAHDNSNDPAEPAPKRARQKKKSESARPAAIQTVNRQEALAIGDTYVQHQWNCTGANITNGRIIDPNGTEIETPSWVRAGTNVKIPYQWGGFWRLPDFDARIQAGKYAGDIATSGVSAYGSGVDCSGFVSRCWKLNSHYSTRMMDDRIAVAYPSWNDLKPADAVHKPGHVRLFVDFNPNGSLLTVEAAGRDWRVSYRSYSLSQLSGYMPRYYYKMEGMPGSLPLPELRTIQLSDSVQLAWELADISDVAGLALYRTENGTDWQLHPQGQNLPPVPSACVVEKVDQIPQFFKVKAISSAAGNMESYPSDTYGYFSTIGENRILIVDGFDRTDGSYPFPYHEFSMTMGLALSQAGCAFETVSNDAVSQREVSLMDYAAVFWLLGDESTADETFSTTEQNLVKVYLQQGGKLLVTGSEVAWDLDYKGSANDKSFITNYLKTSYQQDDSESYTVNGVSGTAFAGLTLHYDDGTHGVYEEDWPDAFQAENGSFAALKYANGLIAATAFDGLIPGGGQSAKVFLMGFPFETIYAESERTQFIEKLLAFFEFPTTPVEETTGRKPGAFYLFSNYPNPFNPGTSIRFQLSEAGPVKLKIYSLLGREVRELANSEYSAGLQKIYWNGRDACGRDVAAGVYIYRLQTDLGTKQRKMLLLR